MPTYDYRCRHCAYQTTVVQSISEYVRAQQIPNCVVCDHEQRLLNDHASPTHDVHHVFPMERIITVVPGLAIGNALASERHYDGMRAQDGTPIDTRSKHREYMKRNNLTTVDDFKSTWKKQAVEREQRIAGHDPSRARDIAEAVTKLGG